MEPETAAFLKRIGKSMTMGFVWLALTCVFAIKGDNAFVNGSVRIGNILFYLWFVISIVVLVVLLKKLWAENVDLDIQD